MRFRVLLRILKSIFENIQLNYYTSRYFNELKKAADSQYETMKDFIIKMGSSDLSKAFEIIRKAQYKKFNYDISYEEFLDYFYKSYAGIPKYRHWIINKYGIDTWKLFLRAGGFELEEKPSETINTQIPQLNNVISDDYAKEIQKHLLDLDCTFTTAGHISAMALKQDRSALDQAISFCVGAIAENYSKNLIQLMLDGHSHLTKTSDNIKNYYENGQISKLAYQSVISTLGSCLNPNKTDEEKTVLDSLIKQNYLGDEILVSISG